MISFLPQKIPLKRSYAIGGVFNKESKQLSVELRSFGGFLLCFGVSIGESNVQFSGSLDNSKSKISKNKVIICQNIQNQNEGKLFPTR